MNRPSSSSAPHASSAPRLHSGSSLASPAISSSSSASQRQPRSQISRILNRDDKSSVQSSVLGSRRSKKKKREELARIIDERGRDVTPLALSSALNAALSVIASSNAAQPSLQPMIASSTRSFMAHVLAPSFSSNISSSQHNSVGASFYSNTGGDEEKDTTVKERMGAHFVQNTADGSALLNRTKSLGLGLASFAIDDEDKMLASSSTQSQRYHSNNFVDPRSSPLTISLQDAKDSEQVGKPVSVYVRTAYDSFALANPSRPTVVIAETSTVTLFTMPSLRVNEGDTVLKAKVKAENKAYLDLKGRKKEKDKFSVNFAQTINLSERDKACQCTPAVKFDTAVQASAWMIFDEIINQKHVAVQASDQNEQELHVHGFRPTVLFAQDAEEREDDSLFARENNESTASIMPPNGFKANNDSNTSSVCSSALSFNEVVGDSLREVDKSAIASRLQGITDSHDAGQRSQLHQLNPLALTPQLPASLIKLFAQPSFLSSLKAMEHAVLQNIYHREQALYHAMSEQSSYASVLGLPIASHQALVEEKLHLSLLFRFEFSRQPVSEVNSTFTVSPLVSSSITNKLLVNPLRYHESYQQLFPTVTLPVTCIAFNRAHSSDLLVAGYGTHAFGAKQTGRIAFWSAKNPSCPHKWLITSSSVLCCDFSQESPHLLAVGMACGLVAVYDVRLSSSAPLLEASHSTGKHRSCVWQVQWVRRDTAAGSSVRREVLVSVSEDGTVRQWQIKKGLAPKELMILKRNTNPVHVITGNTNKHDNIPLIPKLAVNMPVESIGKKSKTLFCDGNLDKAAQKTSSVSLDGLSRDACGLCFDFAPWDSSQYFAGTEDGWIHHCSVSYNEQTLDTFPAHTGPVYAIHCSPFAPELFLSCSADWTCALWSSNRSTHSSSSHSTASKTQQASAMVTATPVLRFQCGFDDILDCCWHPYHPTMFASVSREGRIDVWDLEQSTLDPICTQNLGRGGQSIRFSPNGSCLLVGDVEGGINVQRIYGIVSTEAPAPIIKDDYSHDCKVSQASRLFSVARKA